MTNSLILETGEISFVNMAQGTRGNDVGWGKRWEGMREEWVHRLRIRRVSRLRTAGREERDVQRLKHWPRV